MLSFRSQGVLSSAGLESGGQVDVQIIVILVMYRKDMGRGTVLGAVLLRVPVTAPACKKNGATLSRERLVL